MLLFGFSFFTDLGEARGSYTNINVINYFSQDDIPQLGLQHTMHCWKALLKSKEIVC